MSNKQCCLLILVGFLVVSPSMSLSASIEDKSRGVIVQLRDDIIQFPQGQNRARLEEVEISDSELLEDLVSARVQTIRGILQRAHSRKFRNRKMIQMPNFEHTFLLICDSGNEVAGLVHALKENSSVIYAESNDLTFFMNDCTDPDDPLFPVNYDIGTPYQWWFTGARGHPDSHINILPAWDLTCGDSNTLVGQFDYGVRQSHQDLSPRVTGDGADHPHGTRTCGIVGGISNSVGMIGMVQEAQIRAFSMFFYSAEEYADSLLSAVDNWGCDVIGTSNSVELAFSDEICITIKNLLEAEYLKN